MLDLGGAHGAAAAANAITSNRFSYSMNLKVGRNRAIHEKVGLGCFFYIPFFWKN